jgi:predicted anti-sigma-YlaC factor YlaD
MTMPAKRVRAAAGATTTRPKKPLAWASALITEASSWRAARALMMLTATRPPIQTMTAAMCRNLKMP